MSPSLSLVVLRAQSDARLLDLAATGSERAFEVLAQRYRGRLVSYCVRLGLPRAYAEDVAQQTLLIAWSAIGDGTSVRHPGSWLHRIAHNGAVDALKRASYGDAGLDEHLAGIDTPDQHVQRRADLRHALEGVAGLPELQREVLLRTALAGESHSEVATAMGLSAGSVRGLLYRARSAMRATVTGLTPLPLVTWSASRSSSVRELGEAGAAAASAGVGGTLLKGGAVLAGVAAIASVPVVVDDAQRPDGASPPVGVGEARAAESPDGGLGTSVAGIGLAGATRLAATRPGAGGDPGQHRGTGTAREGDSGRDNSRQGADGHGETDHGGKGEDRSQPDRSGPDSGGGETDRGDHFGESDSGPGPSGDDGTGELDSSGPSGGGDGGGELEAAAPQPGGDGGDLSGGDGGGSGSSGPSGSSGTDGGDVSSSGDGADSPAGD